MKIKYSPKGVEITAENGVEIITQLSQLDTLIKKLLEARISFVEHMARSAEEAQQQVWESI